MNYRHPGMIRPVLRVSLCVLIGLFVGSILGPLFVPNPTGMLSTVLALGIAVITSVFLYRSNWLYGRKPVA